MTLTAADPRGRRYPASAAVRARELREAGWSIDRCRDFIAQEFGHRPTFHTFKRWTDPAYQRSRDAAVARRRRLRTTYSFRLVKGGEPTPEYESAFIRRLRAEGATVASIAATCRVVFDDSWTYARVRYLLEERAESPA